MMNRSRVLAIGMVALSMPLWSSSAQADVVTDYNDALIQLFREAPVDPELAAYATARMNVSAFDAVNAITGGYTPYLFSGKPSGPASAEAAAAQAAHDALVVLPFFQAQVPIIDDLLADQLAKIPDGDEKTNGIALGKEAALAIIEARENDGSNPSDPPPYAPGSAPGDWQPTPPDFLAADKPWWGSVTPFVLPSVAGFADPPGPPALDSPEYTVLFNQVKDYGKLDSAVRTQEQTRIALFWSEQEPGQRTPPGSWVSIASTLAKSQNTTLIESARLFALLGLAMADAGIDAWEVKYQYSFWRPVTAIQEAADDGNPDTEADPTWESLLPAPNFPAYFSGHSNFGWSAASVLQGFFGTDDLSFTVTSDTLAPETIDYTSVSAAASDNGIARIYLGVHFDNENVDAQDVGSQIGTYVFEHALLPDGSAGAGGSGGSGGSGASGGSGGSGGGADDAESSGGCACAVPAGSTSLPWASSLVFAASALAFARRRNRRNR